LKPFGWSTTVRGKSVWLVTTNDPRALLLRYSEMGGLIDCAAAGVAADARSRSVGMARTRCFTCDDLRSRTRQR